MKRTGIQSARVEDFWICCLLLALSGGTAVFWGWYGYGMLSKSARLVRASCVIQDLRPASVTSYSPKGAKSTTNYTEVVFEYAVDGETYQSREFSVWGYSDGAGFEWGDDFGGLSATEMLAGLNVEEVRHCWYDPADPSYAVLARTLSYYWLLCGGILLVCLIIAVAGMYVTRRAMRRASRNPPAAAA